MGAPDRALVIRLKNDGESDAKSIEKCRGEVGSREARESEREDKRHCVQA